MQAALQIIAEKDARIAELEASIFGLRSDVSRLRIKNKTFSDAWGSEGEAIAELAAIKAQEPVIDAPYGGILRIEAGNLPDSWVRINPCKLYAAPVAKPQVVMPDLWQSAVNNVAGYAHLYSSGYGIICEIRAEVARLNAADHAEGGV
ncbi:MAG: hypothetical protein K2Y25_07435 [Pseudomonadaceae bacterium]|nr:hypothetical protein [Pseudomonadaceae bacterium]